MGENRSDSWHQSGGEEEGLLVDMDLEIDERRRRLLSLVFPTEEAPSPETQSRGGARLAPSEESFKVLLLLNLLSVS